MLDKKKIFKKRYQKSIIIFSTIKIYQTLKTVNVTKT